MPLGQRPGDPNSESRYCGAELEHTEDIQYALSSSISAGFDFIVSPLTNPDYRPSKVDGSRSHPPFVGSDLVLSPSQWSSHVVGRVSQWIDPESPDDILRCDSEVTLSRELSWASHLSLQACILPSPKPLNCGNYARCVNQLLHSMTNVQLWLRIPLQTPQMEAAEVSGTEETAFLERDPVGNRLVNDSWEWWHMFRTLCEHHSQLSVVLDITSSLPPPAAVERWTGEPLKAVILHTSAFLTNKLGYPCLPKRHQRFITTLFNHSVQIILSDRSSGAVLGPGLNSEDSSLQHPLKLYRDYVANFYRKLDPLTVQEQFELGYRDYLQAPLQPLMDNLEAQTYETFEKDATKYNQYQKAIESALADRRTNLEAEASSDVVVLMVVGAGRGPLVRASLEAARTTGSRLRVYAVEKNPNAVVTLSRLIEMEGWEDTVTLVSCDMRSWDAPELADILVSELLGSFGDNELSPECLDGAQRFLKDDGISIPSSYTSYIGPIAASKIYNDVKSHNDLAHFETAYVVKLHNAVRLAQPQPVFTFEHPKRSNGDNRRYKKLTFQLPPDTGSAVVHGFGGYFDAVLYKDIHLGIEPSTATPDMFSWFAIFFPLRSPVYVPAGAVLEAQFWRCVASTKVWYEWCITAPSVSAIHNPSGRSYWVGL